MKKHLLCIALMLAATSSADAQYGGSGSVRYTPYSDWDIRGSDGSRILKDHHGGFTFEPGSSRKFISDDSTSRWIEENRKRLSDEAREINRQNEQEMLFRQHLFLMQRQAQLDAIAAKNKFIQDNVRSNADRRRAEKAEATKKRLEAAKKK
jgi:hypothetical protein